ncbi:hypothetical protein POTOM_007163 [Populus tomentosa]|uniref:Leucine-rich repeat-containing N-terminal plant-type domain-containing protein n=1 Tax=Populus tomentosa TaxID=118781 RepID=A0A8X8AC33_POPTO|nr:hypothetical protein POTOM_007163 [Populus tomentosa]
MASIDSEPKLLAILSISFFLSCIFVSVAALDDSALLASEGKALLESGWWSDYSNLTSHRCNWTGIVCDRAGSITEISPPPWFLKVGNKFAKMNFSCFLNLVRLHLPSHELSGSIPPQISILPQLRYLDLSSNYLAGELPSSLGNLSRLVELDFSSNYFYNSIPPELGNLKNLVTLSLSDNSFSGPIPSALCHLDNLTHLLMDLNSLEGALPREIGKMRNLEILDVSYNVLYGPIPPTLGRLAKLRSLIFRDVRISGSIPLEIGNLTNLEDLDLSFNQITGLIPFWLFNKLDKARPLSQPNQGIHPFIFEAITLKEVLDPRLPPPTNEIVIQNICTIASLIFSCLHSNPKYRPSMKFVSQEFLSPKRLLGGLEISLLELRNLAMHTNVAEITGSSENERDFFGSDGFGLKPIRTESTSTTNTFQKKSIFFEESVAGSPMSRFGNSPRFSEAGDHFDNYSRFDSFSMNEGGFSPREKLTRFDSINSSKDFGHSRAFSSFDDGDPFGSSAPFKVSSEDQTPKKSSGNWSSF